MPVVVKKKAWSSCEGACSFPDPYPSHLHLTAYCALFILTPARRDSLPSLCSSCAYSPTHVCQIPLDATTWKAPRPRSMGSPLAPVYRTITNPEPPDSQAKLTLTWAALPTCGESAGHRRGNAGPGRVSLSRRSVLVAALIGLSTPLAHACCTSA